ncbi:hypothetical protein N7456_008171 [Penicillium angulare]|uniref:SET domain-containing protein n=1 Tax=Penicillium angulare TaxID=116970 RepID=A0A9W9FC95_9EURO|nr:hypothetical protein N7456_008171 [Penicillium angulare]
MPEDHLYRYLEIPKGVPIELKSSPGKGWGAFATKRIKQETLVLTENPLFVIRRPMAEITEEVMIAHYRRLSDHQKSQFLLLSAEDAMSKVFFHITRGPNEPETWGVFILQSRFNHSCAPNSKTPPTGTDVVARFAIREIAKGEEITACYDPDARFRTMKERHKFLGWICSCSVCRSDPLSQQLSDMRRRLIRGLHYLLMGSDIDGQRQSGRSPIIMDPKLKDEAETFNIPLSSILFYEVLTMFLLEEEGLMDYFVLDFLLPILNKTAKMFKSERNSRIAQFIVKRNTALERLQVGFRFYGQKDATDPYVTELVEALPLFWPSSRLS